ncbi:GxxExxY protein [Marinilabilia sp.]
MEDKELTRKIIGCFYNVYNVLGFGFLEKVYEKALMLELSENGLYAERQKPIKVYYGNSIVGEYFADVVVENSVILELKACENILDEHEYQLINYLKATEIEIGFLFNFGKKPEFRRKIYSNTKLHL